MFESHHHRQGVAGGAVDRVLDEMYGQVQVEVLHIGLQRRGIMAEDKMGLADAQSLQAFQVTGKKRLFAKRQKFFMRQILPVQAGAVTGK